MTFPAVPLGNQWSHPKLEDDTDLHAKIDTQLNALRTQFRALPGSAAAQFYGVLRSTTASLPQTLFTALDTVITDNLSGWDATNHWYVVPATGLYMFGGAVRDASTTSSGNAFVYCPNLPSTFHAPNGPVINGSASAAPLQVARLQAGWHVSLGFNPAAAMLNINAPASDSTFLQIEQVAA